MKISAKDVMKLRKATNAGMMDCKHALAESEGDFDRAIDIIREKGKLVAQKRSGRDAGEGDVLAQISEDKKFGTIIVLNCETDFVAKNQGFIDLTKSFLDVAVKKQPSDLESLKSEEIDGRSIADLVTEQVGIIGEKLELSYYGKVEGEEVAEYIHPGNRLAAVVGFNKTLEDPQVGKEIAMQIAAMAPVAVDKEDVPKEVAEKELEIAKEKFRMEGKPEKMIDRIAQGALQKFFKENTLLNQASIRDSKMTVREYLKSVDKDLKITSFIRYALD